MMSPRIRPAAIARFISRIGRKRRGGSRLFLPFSPCGRRWREAPDEGSLSAERNPSPVRDASHRVHPLPQGVRGRKRVPHEILLLLAVADEFSPPHLAQPENPAGRSHL